MAEPADQSRLDVDTGAQPQPQDQAGDQEQPDEPNGDESTDGDDSTDQDESTARDADVDADEDDDEEKFPSFNDGFIQQFLNGRKALIEEEKRRRSGL